jgi:ATP-dependent protease ClpP protease subunit
MKSKTNLSSSLSDGRAAPYGCSSSAKFWNVASVSDNEAEVTLYGDVCSSQPVDWWTGEAVPGLYITPEGFLEDLEKIKDKAKITVKLNSAGGCLYTGIAIHNALKGLSGHKTVIVEGMAASAASAIMCAGDDIQVYPGSVVMVHGVKGFLRGYVGTDELEKAIKGVEAAEKALAEIYKAKTGKEVTELRTMMSEETWMVGAEAVERGFADTLLDDNAAEFPEMSPTLSADKKMLFVAGVQHDVSSFRNIPGSIPVVNNVTPIKGGESVKTVEE